MEAENEREVLSQMKKKAEQLTLSASPQKKAILGRRSRQFFIDVLKRKMNRFQDGFVFTLHKEFFLQEVTDIARYLGYQETQLSIVPALTSLTNCSDALAQQMLQRLPDLSEVVIQEVSNEFNTLSQLSGNEVKGLAFITTQLFPLICLAFNNAPNSSPEHITTSLHRLVKLSSHQILRERVYNLLVESIFKPSLSAVNDDNKAGAIQLMADNLDILSTAQIQKFITSQLKVLSSRCIPFKLQKNLAKLLCAICAHPCIATSYFQTLVFPVYFKLLKQQDLWGLRKAAVEGIDKVAYCAILAQRGDWIDQLLEQINSLLEDGSKWVRHQATKVAARFLHTIVSSKKQILSIRTTTVSPSYLKKKEVSKDEGVNLWNKLEKKILSCLVSTVRLTSYSLEDVKFEIAYNFPAFVLIASKQYCTSSEASCFWSKHFQALHKMLAHDLDWNVKKTIAASLHEVAAILINKFDIEDAKPKAAYFLSIVARFLDSELDQVQVNCLHVLPSLFKIFPSELLDGKPKDVFQLIYERNDSRVVTQKKSEILAQFCDIFLPDIVCGVFESCYDKLTTHENALVRKNAASAFGAFYLRMQRCHDIHLANSPGAFSSSFLKKRYASIAAQAAMENYCAPKQYSTNFQQRIVFVQMLGSIMQAYLKKSLPSDAVTYIEYLLSLQNDTVVCVRLAIVTTLKELKEKFKQLDQFVEEAEKAVELFQTDESREIRVRSKLEESPLAQKIEMHMMIDPTNFRFIETELEQEGGAENSNNLSLIQLSQTPSSFTDVLKRAVGGGSSNSFLTQLMNAFEEKDREAKEQQEGQMSDEREDNYENQCLEEKQEISTKGQFKEQKKEQRSNIEKKEVEIGKGKRLSKEVSKSPNDTPKHRTAPTAGARKSNPKLLSLRPASAYKKQNGLSLIKSSRATSASSENAQRLREVGSATGLPPLQPKQTQKSLKASMKSDNPKRLKLLDKTTTKQSLPNLAEEISLKKGITPPQGRRQGRSSLSSQRPGSFSKSRGQRNLSALSSLHTHSSQRKGGVNLVKQRFLEIATLSNDENENTGVNRIPTASLPLQILQTSAPKRLFGTERLNVAGDSSGILNRLELGQSLKKVRKLKRLQPKTPQQIFGEVPSTLNRSLAGALRQKNSGFNRTSLPGTSFRSHSSSMNSKSTFPSLGVDL